MRRRAPAEQPAMMSNPIPRRDKACITPICAQPLATPLLKASPTLRRWDGFMESAIATERPPWNRCRAPRRSASPRTAFAGAQNPFNIGAKLAESIVHEISMITIAISSLRGASPQNSRISASTSVISVSGARSRCALNASHRRSTPKKSPRRFWASVTPSV